jgi:PmbA protein
VPDLLDLCAAAVEAAEGGEHVEAFGEERSTTSVEAHRGEIAGLTFAESRGLGVRVISDGRLGFAHAADPSVDEVREAVSRARENAAVASPDPFNALPVAEPIEPLDGLFSEALAGMSTEQKVPIALEMERAATTMDPRVGKTESVRYGDAVGAAAIASTEGVRVEYRATGCWVVVVTLAERDGDTQTGFSYRIARKVEDLDHQGVVAEAVERAARMLGATKPATARVPVLLDPVAASSFVGVLSDGLSAESVQKQR